MVKTIVPLIGTTYAWIFNNLGGSFVRAFGGNTCSKNAINNKKSEYCDFMEFRARTKFSTYSTNISVHRGRVAQNGIGLIFGVRGSKWRCMSFWGSIGILGL